MNSICALGIDVGGTKTVLTLIDNIGTHKSEKLDSLQIFHSATPPADLLAQHIRDYFSTLNVSTDQVQGIVIGVPGIVDPADDIVTSCPNLPSLEGYPLGASLSEILHIPVLIENDVNLMTIGEHARGAGKGVKNLATVYVGTGIGGGLIIDGRRYTGADGAAGEIGHMTIVAGGRRCTCGRRGCLEMYCSGKALAIQAEDILGVPVEGDIENNTFSSWHLAEDVIKAAASGNSRAHAAVEEAFYYLGIGIVDLASIANPQLVLLGGGILTGWPKGIEIVRKTVYESARFPINERLRVEPVALKEQASAIGALLLIQQRSAA